MRTAWTGLALIALLPAAAEAGLEICNDTGQEQSVAIAQLVEGTWTSEGWWNIQPGECALPVAGDLTNRYYYYRAEVPGGTFDDEGVYFCTLSEAFTIPGQEDCAERGYGRDGFRRIDTGQTATHFTFTLVAPEALRAPGQSDRKTPEPQAREEPAPETTAEDGAQPGLTRRTRVGPERWDSGFVQGSAGEPFDQLAVFQGCDVFDGAEYCAFHAEGWKWFAYRGGPTPDAFLDRLRTMPRGMDVRIEGDILNWGDITVEMALSRVSLLPGTNPNEEAFAAIQGAWVSEEDANYTIEVTGSEMTDFYVDGPTGHYFWRFAETCDAAPPDATFVLIKTEPETQEQLCFLPTWITRDSLRLIYADTGDVLSFRRP